MSGSQTRSRDNVSNLIKRCPINISDNSRGMKTWKIQRRLKKRSQEVKSTEGRNSLQGLQEKSPSKKIIQSRKHPQKDSFAH